MYELSDLVFAGIACAILGAGIGVLVARSGASDQRKTRELEKHLNESQEAMKSYQQDVTSHFVRTAELLQELSEGYREVHNHLAKGAQNLTALGDEAPLRELPEFAMGADDESSAADVRAPLDYAPKRTPYDKGMLEDDFGLEKEPVEAVDQPRL